MPRDDAASGARPTETEVAIIRDVARYVVEPVETTDKAVLERLIRRAVEFADRPKLRRLQAERRKLIASAVLYADVPSPEVARLARLTDEGVRTAVRRELGLTRKARDPGYEAEYRAARTEKRPDIENPGALDELSYWGDLVVRAKASFVAGEALRDQLMIRAHALGVRGETLENWTGLGRKRVTDIVTGQPFDSADDADDADDLDDDLD
ncbi:MAG: hypothetical protein ACFCVF_05565 [Kineosporiaceae bacterium]